jgi:hypothetical protein
MYLEIAKYTKGVLVEVHKLSIITKMFERPVFRHINRMDLINRSGNLTNSKTI